MAILFLLNRACVGVSQISSRKGKKRETPRRKKEKNSYKTLLLPSRKGETKTLLRKVVNGLFPSKKKENGKRKPSVAEVNLVTVRDKTGENKSWRRFPEKNKTSYCTNPQLKIINNYFGCNYPHG